MKTFALSLFLTALHVVAIGQDCPQSQGCPPQGSTTQSCPPKQDCQDGKNCPPSKTSYSKISNAALIRELQKGGYVLAFRHGKSDWTKNDATKPLYSDRGTQRPLSEDGKAQARTIARALRDMDIPVGKVLASPMFRARDFADIAFGRHAVEPKLVDTKTSCSANVKDFERFASTAPAKGTNTVLSGHQLCQIELEEGDAAVIKPLGHGKFEVIARLSPRDWETLRLLALRADAGFGIARFAALAR